MENKKFIKEKIVGRRESWRKRLLHYVRVILSALLFGGISAGVFVLATPFFQSRKALSESERVELHMEDGGREERPETESAESEESIPETETEPISDVVQSELENYHFSLSDYTDMMQGIKSVISEAEKSLVEVTKSVNSRDFLGVEVESEDSYSGIILTMTETEVLIFTQAEAVKDLTKLEVSFLRDNRYEASVKAVDELDNLAVICVPLKNIMEKDRNLIKPIPFGNSKILKRGDLLLAIGAPAGVLYSSSMGEVSYLNYNQPAIDSGIEDIRADMNASFQKGSFVLNAAGELVGWVSGQMGESEEGFCRIAGLSDFLSRMELLSNGKTVPYIGLEIQGVSSQMERQGIPSGVYVRSAQTDSPAYIAGIQAGDIVTGINEESIRSVDNFESELEKAARDDTINLTVRRTRGQDYAELSFPVTVGGR